MKSDIQIAQEAEIFEIVKVAESFGIDEKHLELYGKYKAKISDSLAQEVKGNPDGKLVLVTAINPTPAGEGKTTTTIGLTQALNKVGKKAIAALREPSLGPCMGVKGGAAGGGYAQVIPMEDINLHFTGDIHAITAAHNLLSALIDNHLHQGNALDINPSRIIWKRCMDMNDRSIRQTVVGLGDGNGIVREDGFMMTVASEVMAICCLAEDLNDLKQRLSRMIIGYNRKNEPVYAGDLQAQGAMTALLKEAIKPNMVQTLEHTPVFIHGGPFANIAHGCNSVRATKLALKLADIVVTEAGFGADLGAEKFFDIKCRYAGLKPDAVVLVATVRALKYNGGVERENLSAENTEAVSRGLCNLRKHIENLQQFKVPVVVSLNHFVTDTGAELDIVRNLCKETGTGFAISKAWAEGGAGGVLVANEVINILDNKKSEFDYLYPLDIPVKEKIETICTKIYGASGVIFSAKAQTELRKIGRLKLNHLPVCIAKTQYSFSDDQKLLGRPENFEITIKDIRISNGAGFAVALAGDIMTMPGLPKIPSANSIDVDENGNITGLF